jgi:hypothetical protein
VLAGTADSQHTLLCHSNAEAHRRRQFPTRSRAIASNPNAYVRARSSRIRLGANCGRTLVRRHWRYRCGVLHRPIIDDIADRKSGHCARLPLPSGAASRLEIWEPADLRACDQGPPRRTAPVSRRGRGCDARRRGMPAPWGSPGGASRGRGKHVRKRALISIIVLGESDEERVKVLWIVGAINQSGPT